MDVSTHAQTIAPPAERHGNPTFVYVAEAFIQPIILIVGFLTNIASSLVLRKVHMNEVFRICLMALSILDALACLVGFAQLVVEVSYFDGDIIQGTLDPPAIASNTLYYIYLMLMCSSATVVITIAIIRNLFVLKPMKSRSMFTSGTTKVICFINFLVTLLLFAPVSLKILSQSCEKEVNVPICDWMNSTDPTLHRVGNVYLHYFLSTLFGPVLIIVYIICFLCIQFTVAKSVRQLSLITPRRSTSVPGTPVVKQHMSEDARARSKTAKRITKTLLIILMLDVVCTLPLVIQGVGLLFAKGVGIFDKESQMGQIYDVIVEIFLNLRPSYNFWLYIYQHPVFRVRLKTVFLRICAPCFRSERYCPCCKPELLPTTPMRTPLNWSMSTSNSDNAERSGPWFRRLSSKIQNGNNPLYKMADKEQKYTGQNTNSTTMITAVEPFR